MTTADGLIKLAVVLIKMRDNSDLRQMDYLLEGCSFTKSMKFLGVNLVSSYCPISVTFGKVLLATCRLLGKCKNLTIFWDKRRQANGIDLFLSTLCTIFTSTFNKF